MTDSISDARTEPAAPEPTRPSVFGKGYRATSVGLLLIVTIVAFEAMSVVTAMPIVVESLDGMAFYAWPFSAFMVANLLGMVVAGEVSDRLGPAKPMLAGLATFAAGLLIAGTATTMVQLIAGRLVQGLGGGVLIVVMYVLIGAGYPAELHPRVFGLTAIGWVMPGLIGPVVAGSLAEHAHWRLVFLGLLPLVIVGAVLIVPGLRRTRPRSAGEAGPTAVSGTYRGGTAARWPFALLAGVGVVLLQLAGERLDVVAIPLAVAGVIAVVLAVRVLLPVGTGAAGRGLPAVVLMRGLAAGSFFAVDTLVPLTLSSVHGWSAVGAGLPLTFGALGWSSASWLQGRYPKLPRSVVVGTGMAAVGVACASMAVIAWVPGSAWAAFPAWIFGGLGMGLVMPSLAVLLLEFSTDADRGRNSASLQISDALLSSLTIGFSGVLVAAATAGAFRLSTAVGVIDLAMVAVAIVGIAVAPRLRRSAAPRLRHRASTGAG
ncbi:MFS transporter [Cryptosporangium aurantiacum]|uniref:MFS transporter n=1 Tax=Cryptosporangium aurantiacum TaxID=134849 RepID=UPI001C4A3B47|nr:MFS transporter [Cryptosporangium aurantiacum]